MKTILRILYEFRLIPTKLYARLIGVKFGKNCSFQKINFPTEPYLIKIGDHVQITRGTSFYTHTGGWVIRKRLPNWDVFGKIEVGNNVYIGNNVMIMPGVKIGDNVIIGAGSVVTKSVPPNVVIAGNPARIICSIDEYISKYEFYNLNIANVKNKRKNLESLSEDRFIKKQEMKL